MMSSEVQYDNISVITKDSWSGDCRFDFVT